MIYDHTSSLYVKKWLKMGGDRWNGAYYYSQEIVKNIIPRVTTDRHWVTVNVEGMCQDHSIVFIHNNQHPELYSWLENYKDLVLVCGIPETCKKVEHLGRAIYLPLSIDLGYVTAFKQPKTKDTCYVGRRTKLPDTDIDVLTDMERDRLLLQLGQYRQAYAVGRCAIEAKALGCKVLPYDERYPDPSIWKVRGNFWAAKELQRLLDA